MGAFETVIEKLIIYARGIQSHALNEEAAIGVATFARIEASPARVLCIPGRTRRFRERSLSLEPIGFRQLL
jgi:hypothetical protein